MAPCPAPRPRGSSPGSSLRLRAPAPSLADRVPSRVLLESDAAWDCKRRRRQGEGGDDDDFRASKKRAVGSVASPVAHLSCARIRPFVYAARPTTSGDAHELILKEKTGERICCKKIEPASRPKNSARTVAHGVITKQKASEKIPCTRTRPAVQASGVKDKAKAGSVAGVLRSDVIKTKQEASERVQAAVAKSIPPIRPPAPATTKNHQDPYAPHDSLRAALVAARQALDRRQHNVYRQQRGAARRELDKVVQTVFFDDPHITLEGVLKSLGC